MGNQLGPMFFSLKIHKTIGEVDDSDRSGYVGITLFFSRENGMTLFVNGGYVLLWV